MEDLLLEDETMEELYKVMDDLLDLEFQIKVGMDILKELEELYMSDSEKRRPKQRNWQC